jgi:mannose/cellobiose epimerase-like protein (N-acyl-D-glucosamine 2-epimerase family)
MDSEALRQIKSAVKEAVDDAIDRKVGDIVEYKMNSLMGKIESRISPLTDKLNAAHDLSTRILNGLSELKYEDMAKVKTQME